jgi:hypothetical protein
MTSDDLTVDSQLTKLHLRFGSTKSLYPSRDQKELAKLPNDILQIIRILNNYPHLASLALGS